MRSSKLPKFGVAAAATLSLLWSAGVAHAQDDYLVIGDSYDFGYTTAAGTPFNTGLQGYVTQFAAHIDTNNGALPAPNVINLARPGEGLDTFNTATTTPGGTPNYNQNYAPTFNTTQAEAVLSTFALLGGAPEYISVHLGGNDFIRLFTSPEFLFADDATRLALAQERGAFVVAAMQNLMTELRAIAPTSTLILLSYPDPLAGLDGIPPTNPAFPVNPVGPLSTLISENIRDAYAQIAALPNVNAHFVNLHDPFVGKEKTHTLVLGNDQGLPNIHLNELGNDLVSDQMAITVFGSAVAPEPGTFALFGVGVLAMAAWRRRK